MKLFRVVVLIVSVTVFGRFDTIHAQTGPLPPLEPITASNAGQATRLAFWGRGEIQDMAWAPDGKTLAVVTTTGVWLYDTNQPDRQPKYLMDWTGLLLGDSPGPVGLAFSLDGSLLAFSSNHSLILWDVVRGVVAKTFPYLTARISLFSPGGKWLGLIDSYGDTLDLINVSSGERLTLFYGTNRPPLSVNGEQQQLHFSHDESQVSAFFRDGLVHHWDLATGDELTPISACPQTYRIVGFLSDDSVLCSGYNRLISVSVVTKSSTNKVNIAALLSPSFTTLLVSSDGSHLLYESIGPAVNTLHIRNLQTNTETVIHESYGLLAMTPDGERLAIRSAGLHLWDTKSGQQTAWIQSGFLSAVRALVFNPDSSILASASYDNTVRFWDPKTGQDKVIWQDEKNPASALAFSPDGQVLSIGTKDGTTLIWDLKTAQPVGSVRQSGEVRTTTFSPDGKMLAVAADQVVLWALPSHTRLTTLPATATEILLFRADSQWLETDSLLWKVEASGRLVAGFDNLSAKVQASNQDALVWSQSWVLAEQYRVWPTVPGVGLVASTDAGTIYWARKEYNEALILIPLIPDPFFKVIVVSGDDRLIAYGDSHGVISLIGVPAAHGP